MAVDARPGDEMFSDRDRLTMLLLLGARATRPETLHERTTDLAAAFKQAIDEFGGEQTAEDAAFVMIVRDLLNDTQKALSDLYALCESALEKTEGKDTPGAKALRAFALDVARTSRGWPR